MWEIEAPCDGSIHVSPRFTNILYSGYCILNSGFKNLTPPLGQEIHR